MSLEESGRSAELYEHNGTNAFVVILAVLMLLGLGFAAGYYVGAVM